MATSITVDGKTYEIPDINFYGGALSSYVKIDGTLGDVDITSELEREAKREMYLRQLDDHYTSISDGCVHDGTGHVCWSPKFGLCGSATMVVI